MFSCLYTSGTIQDWSDFINVNTLIKSTPRTFARYDLSYLHNILIHGNKPSESTSHKTVQYRGVYVMKCVWVSAVSTISKYTLMKFHSYGHNITAQLDKSINELQ